MKVGTDGTLLGAWAHGGSRVLDIGTGTGLLALMMAQRFPASQITAIDIDGEACEQARQNVALSPFSDRVEVLHKSLQQFCDETAYSIDNQTDLLSPSFDSIVCNPPFFVNSLKAPDAQRSIARHADTLTYAQLFRAVSILLAPQGEFSVIVPFDCREAFMAEAFLHALHLVRLCAVSTTPNRPPRRYLLSFSRQPASEVERTEGVIQTAPNVRSPWYQHLTADFYL